MAPAPGQTAGASQEPVVFVVDDDASSLKAVTSTISAADWNVRSFSAPETFLDAYDADQPGCIVLDVRMPVLGGLAVQERLAERGSHTPIVFISAYSDVPAVVAAMKGGAIDFLEKPFTSAHLLEQVGKAVQKDADQRRARAEQLDVERRLALLTRREMEVLELVLAAKLNKQIAAELGIAQRTVEVHRRQIMRKMKADTGIHLARIVLSARKEAPPERPLRRIHNIPSGVQRR